MVARGVPQPAAGQASSRARPAWRHRRPGPRRDPKEVAMSRLLRIAAATLLAASVSACAVYPAGPVVVRPAGPAYGAHWVPGHWNAWRGWVPGHWV
jgi:hypothetical protein